MAAPWQRFFQRFAEQHNFNLPVAAGERVSSRGQRRAMMTSELRYLLKTTSDGEACSDQESLRVLLADLRAVADDLDLDFARAYFEAAPPLDRGRCADLKGE
jgi:hypothetical protein